MYLFNVETADRCSMILSKTRSAAHISRRAMSESIHVSESTIKAWEAGQGSPTISVIMEWFRVVGENIFSYMLEFFWPESIGTLHSESTDAELRESLSVYLQEVAGVHEIRKLHYLVSEQYGGSWLGMLDMFCAHTYTSLKNRYKIAEIIDTSYELSVANNKVQQTNLFPINNELLKKAITAARTSTLSHKHGYTMKASRNDFQATVSAVLKRARLDAGVELSYMAKALGKTERTVRNWEENTEPAFLEVCSWFHILGKHMWPYFRGEMFPGETSLFDADAQRCRAELLRHYATADRLELRKLCYLIFWKHGSNWHSLLELMIEHVSSPLYQRVISARSVLIGYELDSNEARLNGPMGTMPDIENLKQCIEKGTQASKAGALSY